MSTRANSGSMDLRVQRTYKLLKEALIRLLEQKPFDDITVQEICEEAMLRRTTFYQHFEDKQDFLNWFVHEKQQEFMARTITMPSQSGGDLKEFYTEAGRRMLRYLNENRKLVEVLSKSGIQGQSMLDSFARICVEDVISRMESALKEKNKTLNVPVPLVAEFYIGGIAAVIRWWFVDGKQYTEEEMTSYIVSIIPDHAEVFINAK